MAPDEYTFTKFSKNNFYEGVNRRLVEMADIGSGQRIVDLACGTGGVTKLMLERLRDARDSVIIAVDHSATALKQAMEELKGKRNSAIQFVQSRVEQLSESLKESVDTIVFCNAIHYISDKDALVEEISKSLKPGGKFAFSTTFYEGSRPPESLAFYRKWMFKAIRILRGEYDLSPSKGDKVESRRQLTPEQYGELMENHGLKIVRQEIETVNVPIEGWLDISAFEDFITGTLPGVPLDKASAALQKAVQQTFEELKIEYVPRSWLDVIAVRAA